MSEKQEPVVLSDDAFVGFEDVAAGDESLLRTFGFLAEPLEARNLNFKGFAGLQIERSSDGRRITIDHAGTRLHFDYRSALDERNQPVGVVYCTLAHDVFGPAQREPLGSFVIHQKGQTNLRTTEHAGQVKMKDADQIVIHFLHAAHRRNFALTPP